uniref:carbohydrate-binding domain-containing protein n=1 Tax=Seonamhaeicola sp. TaxID=1912245 RepID=UPI00356474A9
TIEINGGEITITEGVEGIEAPDITINNGTLNINTSDDAINAAGATSNNLYITGGYIVIDCSGDGLDSNGNLTMTGGTVILNGPTAQSNSPLDCDGTLSLDGGFLVATGYASNMDEAGSSSSDQYSVLVKLSSTQSAGSLFHIQNSSGESILTFKPAKKYKSVVFSSSSLGTGTYNIYLGGSSTGTETNGLYENETYTPGTLYKSFTISSKTTTVN